MQFACGGEGTCDREKEERLRRRAVHRPAGAGRAHLHQDHTGGGDRQGDDQADDLWCTSLGVTPSGRQSAADQQVERHDAGDEVGPLPGVEERRHARTDGVGHDHRHEENRSRCAVDPLTLARGQGDDTGDHPDRATGDVRPQQGVGTQMHPGGVARSGLQDVRQRDRRQRCGRDGEQDGGDGIPGCHGTILVHLRVRRHDPA